MNTYSYTTYIYYSRALSLETVLLLWGFYEKEPYKTEKDPLRIWGGYD